MANEKAALNLSCHAGGQWKDDGCKSVRAASVNGVVVWLGNPRGKRRESEKEYMTEGGGNKPRVQRYAIEMLSLHFQTPAAEMHKYALCNKAVERILRNLSSKTRLNMARRKRETD